MRGPKTMPRCFPSPPLRVNFRTSKVQAILPTVFDRVVPEGNATSFKVRLTVQPVGSVNEVCRYPVTVICSQAVHRARLSTPRIGTSPKRSKFRLKPIPIPQTERERTLSATGIPSATVELSELDSGTSLESNFLVSGIVRNDRGWV